MSATPPILPLWTGFFASSGSPALKIIMGGPFTPGQEFEAVVDTGFTGFVSMPLLRALPLGLVLYGTTTVLLADGTRGYRLTAQGEAKVGGESRIGVVVLEPNSTEVLIGMAFLRQFGMALYLSSSEISLVSESFLNTVLKPSAEVPEPPEPPKTPN